MSLVTTQFTSRTLKGIICRPTRFHNPVSRASCPSAPTETLTINHKQ